MKMKMATDTPKAELASRIDRQEDRLVTRTPE